MQALLIRMSKLLDKAQSRSEIRSPKHSGHSSVLARVLKADLRDTDYVSAVLSRARARFTVA